MEGTGPGDPRTRSRFPVGLHQAQCIRNSWNGLQVEETLVAAHGCGSQTNEAVAARKMIYPIIRLILRDAFPNALKHPPSQ